MTRLRTELRTRNDRHPHHPRPLRRGLPALLAALAVLAALPAAASAYHTNYFGPVTIAGNTLGSPLTSLPQVHFSNTVESNKDPFPLGQPDIPAPGEFTTCSGGSGTVNIGSSAWYQFFPHRNGNVSVTVTNVTNPASSYLPTLGLQQFNPATNVPAASGPCEVASIATGKANLVVPVTKGSAWKIQVGGAILNDGFDRKGSGFWRFDFVYDPDSDEDGILDSADGCDTQKGPASNGGCPLAIPPPQRINADFTASAGKYRVNGKARGTQIKSAKVTGVPKGARVQVNCTGCRKVKARGGTSKFKAFASNAARYGTKRLPKLKRTRIPRKKKLVVTVTMAGRIGYRVELRVSNSGKAKKVESCLAVGSRSVKVSCSSGS